jgi:predicted histone-like DNA-binding protein
MNLTLNTNEVLQGTKGKYYPRIEYKGQYGVKKLAKYVAKKSSTFTPGEIVGMLTDLVVSIKELALLGYVVKIDDLGLFKASVEGNGLTLKKNAKVSAGIGRQRTDQELQADISRQQFAIGAVKMIMQATGETTPANMSGDAELQFTSKAKDIVKSKTGSDAGEQNGTGDDASDFTAPDAPVISGQTPFSEQTLVTIASNDDADIFYTVDGSEPSEESTRYSEPLTLTDTATVRAVCVKNGEASSVSQKTFTKEAGDNQGGGGPDMG